MTPSIAVLPFVDLSPEKDQEYFSDGLAEELLNSLVKMRGLHVAARTSSFQFKGKNEDLRVIGQRLNVATVLEGSVRKQGQRVRISAQLIQVSDGFHLWSEAYDRDLTDIFAVQEEIARSVAGSLRVTLLGEKPPSAQATSVEAYNAYLQGKYFYGQSSYRPDYEQRLGKAIAYYEQAIKLDPNYAPSWAALAWALEARARVGGDPDPLEMEKDFSKGREAAERALALDPNLAAAYTAMGSIKQYYDWDWAGADACYQRALVLEPGNADIIGSTASLAATLNRFEEAMRLSRRAVELDPLQAGAHFDLAYRAWWLRFIEKNFTLQGYNLPTIAPTGFTYADQNTLDAVYNGNSAVPLWDFFQATSPRLFTPISPINPEHTASFFESYYQTEQQGVLPTPYGPEYGDED